MVQNGRNICTLNFSNGNSFLHLAAQKNHPAILDQFYSAENKDLLNNKHLSILEVYCLSSSFLRVVSHCINADPDFKQFVQENEKTFKEKLPNQQHLNSYGHFKAGKKDTHYSVNLYFFLDFNIAHLSALEKKKITGYIAGEDQAGIEYIYHRKNSSDSWRSVEKIDDTPLSLFFKAWEKGAINQDKAGAVSQKKAGPPH